MKRALLAVVALILTLDAAGEGWPVGGQPARADGQLAKRRKKRVEGRTVGDVVVEGERVIRFFVDAGGLTTVERADAVAERLNRLDAQGTLNLSELQVRDSPGAVALMVGERPVVTVTTADAHALNLPVRDVANLWAANLTEALEGRKVAKIALMGRRKDRRDDRQ